MARDNEPDPEIHKRLKWYIKIRWYLLLAIVVPILISISVGSPTHQQLILDAAVIAIVLATNASFYVLSRLSRQLRYQQIIAGLLILIDIVFVTYFIYARGGIESRSQILYTIPIIASTALFGGAAPYISAVLSAVLFNGLLLAEHFKVIHGVPLITERHDTLSYLITSMIFFTSILIIVGALADFITRLLVRQERAAQAIARSLKRAQAIAKVGSWEMTVANNQPVWSSELYHLFDIDPSLTGDDLSRAYLERIHPEDRPLVEAAIMQCIRTRKSFRLDFRVRRDYESEIVIHCEAKVQLDGKGKVTHIYGTSQDVTEEKKLETAKGDFVSLASHQLRTPASGVRMLLTMLRDGYDGTLNAEQHKTVEQAIESNERLLRIADDLLNVAKLEAGRLQLNKREVELGYWLKTVTAPQKMLARERQQRLRVIVPPRATFARIDPERLAMVLDNLLANARKYTPNKSRIEVELVPGKRSHRIVVRDNGHGMTLDEVNKLFGKFTRLDNEASRGTEGSGLGLYLVKSIIDLHRGTIRVKSKPGQGTVFTISLAQ